MGKLFYFIRKLARKLGEESVAVENITGINIDEVAYAEWSCICVGKSYGETTSCDYDRTYWIPGLVTVPKPPLPPSSCKNPKSWECIVVYVMLEEIGAKETSEFIRKSGGLHKYRV
ncbi:MAG: hypothetical protein ABIG91_00515 [Patescibacteria group bacterium]